MTTPIDLGLVELRCKLRGWTYVRKREGVRVDTPSGVLEVTTRGSVYFGPGLSDHVLETITAPRWTLERLLSEPPEGWRVMDYGVTKTLLWGQPCVWGEDEWGADEVIATLMVSKDFGCVAAKTSVAPSVGPENLARLAERHKAAAELALILAEVEP